MGFKLWVFWFFSEDNVHGHFVRPDHYVVTWWCGDKNDVQSEETRGKYTYLYRHGKVIQLPFLRTNIW